MAEEPGEYRRGHVSKLHDAGDDECGQWNEFPGNRNESSHERNEQRGDTDCKRRSPDSEGCLRSTTTMPELVRTPLKRSSRPQM